jgi:2-aminoadipate transaminase
MTTSTSPIARRAARLTSSAIRDILEHARQPGVISLAGGIPDPALFPVAAFDAACHDALTSLGPAALQYGPTLGEGWFREWAAAATTPTTTADSVVVTSGSQQALDLLAWTLVDPGDEVLVGEPDYLGTLQALSRHDAALLPVPYGHDGWDTEHLAGLLQRGHRPKLAVIVANFHNPTGVTWSEARRRHLLELAERYGFLIVEDDPYGRLWFDEAPPEPIGPGSDRVIRVRSISKFLAPGLRLGWLSASTEIVAAVERAKQAADLHTSTFAQAVVSHLTVAPDHVDVLRSTYGARRDALVDAITAQLPAATLRPPGGGMFCWVDLDTVNDTTATLPAALAAGVAYVPGAAFSPTGGCRQSLRLSFATVGPTELHEGVARLARVVR